MVIFYSYVNAYQRVDCIPQRDGHDMTGIKTNDQPDDGQWRFPRRHGGTPSSLDGLFHGKSQQKIG